MSDERTVFEISGDIDRARAYKQRAESSVARFALSLVDRIRSGDGDIKVLLALIDEDGAEIRNADAELDALRSELDAWRARNRVEAAAR